RDWTEYDQIVQGMSAQEREAPAVRQMEIDALIVQDKVDEARRLLEAERNRDPKLVGPWMMLIGLAGREKSPDALPALLTEAERMAGWHVEWELARASHVLRLAAAGLPGDKALSQLKAIEMVAGRCPDAEKVRLLAALAQA